jgi:hypothetical protein
MNNDDKKMYSKLELNNAINNSNYIMYNKLELNNTFNNGNYRMFKSIHINTGYNISPQEKINFVNTYDTNKKNKFSPYNILLTGAILGLGGFSIYESRSLIANRKNILCALYVGICAHTSYTTFMGARLLYNQKQILDEMN